MRPFRMWMAAIFLIFGALGPSAGAAQGDRFALDDAYHEATSPGHLTVSLNGLWRFQPATDVSNPPPANGWLDLRVPGRWDKADIAYGGFVVRDGLGHILGDWKGRPWSEIDKAWYEREIVLPPACADHRVSVRFDHVGAGLHQATSISHPGGPVDESLQHGAVVWVNGQRAEAEDDWVADVTSLLRPGSNTLAVAVADPGPQTRWGKGLNGDVWLECEPKVRIDHVDWSTTYRTKSLTLSVAVRNGGAAPLNLRVRGVLDGKAVGDTTAQAVAPGQQASFTLDASAANLAPWSEFDPRLTPLVVELLDGDKVVDESASKIAMRDWRFDGVDIKLNGRPVALRVEGGTELGNGMEVFDRDFMRNYLMAYKDAHYNGIRSFWGWVPDYVYDLTDELGLMVEQILPSPDMFAARYGATDGPNFWADYEAFLAKQIAQTRRHASVVAYDLWTHEAGDRLQTQPKNLDGIWAPHSVAIDRERIRYLKARDVLRHLDPSREVLFDDAGNLDKAVDVHAYFDFSIPLQEWEDWPEWRFHVRHGIKPLIVSEMGLPYVASWKEADPWTGNAPGGNGFVIENAARYLGDNAYLLSKSDMLADDWAAFGQGGYDGESAIDPGLTRTEGGVTRYYTNEAAEEVAALFATRVFRAWRAQMVDISPFDQSTMTGASMLFRPLDVNRQPTYRSLKTPGPKPDIISKSAQRYIDTALPVGSKTVLGDAAKNAIVPTKVYAATKAAFSPLLVYIGGSLNSGITSKDHAFASIETIQKSVIEINDGPDAAAVSVEWTLAPSTGGPVVQHGQLSLSAAAGKRSGVPLNLSAPEVTSRTEFTLTISPSVAGKALPQDHFVFQVFPAKPEPPHLPPNLRIGLYDKVGTTAHLLTSLGLTYRRIDTLDDSVDVDLLVIGAMSLNESIAAMRTRLERGMNILVFEQRVGAMSYLAAVTGTKYDTTHMAAAAARTVFLSDPTHPVLAGLTAEDFSDWRGASGYLAGFATASQTNYLLSAGPVAGIKTSNRGIVSSFVLPKPQRGNFHVILSSGFDLRQTPLVEFDSGRGKLLMMQLDVSDRDSSDPVAARIVNNALSYMAMRAPEWARAAYLGGARGKVLFDNVEAQAQDLGGTLPATLGGLDTLLVGAGGDVPLVREREKILAWLNHGGRLVLCDDVVAALGPNWFPSKVSLVPGRLTKGRLPSGETLLRGLNQSDAYFRAGLPMTRVYLREVREEPSPVRVLHVGQGAIVTLPVASAEPLPTAPTPGMDKVTRLVSQILTNDGVRLDVPLTLYPQVIDLTGEWRFKADSGSEGTTAAWYKPELDDSSWKTVQVPSLWASPNPSGEVVRESDDRIGWYRRTVSIPAAWRGAERPLKLVVSGIVDTGDVYWNGTLIAHGTERSYLKQTVTIPIDEALVPYGGTVTLAIKVAANATTGGLAGSIHIDKNADWLTPRVDVRYGERFPDYNPDAFLPW